MREAERTRQPLCAACLSRGFVRLGDSIDHVFPHRRDPERFRRNLFQNLCRSCHSLKTAEESKGRYYDYMRGKIYSEADYPNVV